MNDTNALSNCRMAFIGCGVMAEAIIAGLLRKQLVTTEQVVGSHPRIARREELHEKYGIQMFEHNADASIAVQPSDAYPNSMMILAVKPQRLFRILQELKGATQKGQLIVSIVAGAKIETIAGELSHPAVVRTMPNTPAQ